MPTPLIARLADGEHGWLDLVVGHDGNIDPDQLVTAVAHALVPGTAAMRLEQTDGGFAMVPGDPRPLTRRLIATTMRIIGQTQGWWTDIELVDLAIDLDALELPDQAPPLDPSLVRLVAFAMDGHDFNSDHCRPTPGEDCWGWCHACKVLADLPAEVLEAGRAFVRAAELESANR